MKKSTLVMILALFGGSMVVAACTEEQATAPPPGTSDVCTKDFCANNPGLSQECQTFLDACLANEPEENHDECIGGAALKCGSV